MNKAKEAKPAKPAKMNQIMVPIKLLLIHCMEPITTQMNIMPKAAQPTLAPVIDQAMLGIFPPVVYFVNSSGRPRRASLLK